MKYGFTTKKCMLCCFRIWLKLEILEGGINILPTFWNSLYTFMTPIHNMGVGALSNISNIDDSLLQQLLQNNSSNHIRAKSPVINV